jgi:hypothetical protein
VRVIDGKAMATELPRVVVVMPGDPRAEPGGFCLHGICETYHEPVLNPLADFFAGDPALRGGVRVLLRDADGRADLVTGSGEGEPSRVRVYRSANLLANPSPASDQDLDPFGAVLADGVFVG